MSIKIHEGNLPHIFWIDLKSDGVFTESAVMKRDGLGNVYFFPLSSLDNIDKRRLHRILTNRNAVNFELWDLMSNITLNNGVNALTYFHQLVQVVTAGGQVMNPRAGTIGVDQGTIDTRNADNRKNMEEYASFASKAAADAAAAAAAQVMQGYYGQSQPAPQNVAQSPAPQEQQDAPPSAPRKKTASRSKKTDSGE